jgi:hypothetical protein
MRSTSCSLLVLCYLVASPGSARSQPQFDAPRWLPPSKRDVETREARKVMPSRILLAPGAADAAARRGEPQTLRVRVYATRDYQAQTVGWRDRFHRLIEHINDLAVSWPGVQFEVVAMRGWDPPGGEENMEMMLAKLEQLDPGMDVDWVVGLSSALTLVPTSLHNFGAGRPFGRHFILRGLNDLMEADVLRQQFDAVKPSERERILAERKHHKEQVIFLHEWAHSLGAIHAHGSQLLMNPAYDPEQSRLCGPNAHILAVALRHRRGAAEHPDWQEEMRREIQGYVEATPFPDWDAKGRAELLALLAKETPAGDKARGTPSEPKSTAAQPVVSPRR